MGKKKVVKKGKKPHKNKPTSKKYSKYKIEGDKITRQRFCPRCGPGVFLMHSQGRFYCGKCHYSEFIGKGENKNKPRTLSNERVEFEGKKPEATKTEGEKPEVAESVENSNNNFTEEGKSKE